MYLFFTLQFKTFYELLDSQPKISVNKNGLLEDEEEQNHTTTVFEKEWKVLYYVSTPGIYHCEFQMKCLTHMSFPENAKQIWPKGLLGGWMSGRVDCIGVGHVARTRPGFMNLVTYHRFPLTRMCTLAI